MREVVEAYYGTGLESSADLRTNACLTSAAPGGALSALIERVHEEVRDRYYGCGLVYPPVLEGMRVLDLGCGSGRDCYVLSQLVGEDGFVAGVDMTDAQLDVARRHLEWHTEGFGYARPNVSFHKGYIEKLDALGFEPGSFDVVVSNCVINLAEDKHAVLAGAASLLREGGEVYFSDIYADRRVPTALREDPVLYGECLGGALYWNDFGQLARACGFADPRVVEDHPVSIADPELEARAGHIGFHSATCRLFRLPSLEPTNEDYGQAVAYRGTVTGLPERFTLDKEHAFDRGRWTSVCGNTWRMLHDTRFAPHFEFAGDWATHHGVFAASGATLPFSGRAAPDSPAPASCC